MRVRVTAAALGLLGLVAPGRSWCVPSGAPSIRAILQIIPGPTLLDAFRHPRSLAADSVRGLFVVADTGNHRLVTFDATGRSRGAINYDPTAGEGRLVEPRAVALDERGRLYVVDVMSADVEVMTSTGSHLAFLHPPLPPEAVGQCQPQDVAVGASGRIYLLYTGGRPGLLVMERDGTPVKTLGFVPRDSGPWMGPLSVAVNAGETELAVVDPEAARAITVYSTDGTLLAAFGEHGEGDGTFSMAVHATWGPDGSLWITDTIRHSVSVLDARGRYRGRIGGFGRGPGQFSYPAACAFLARDQIVVLERAGARCQVIGLEMEEVPESHPGLATSGP